jgi:hypothetical protein
MIRQKSPRLCIGLSLKENSMKLNNGSSEKEEHLRSKFADDEKESRRQAFVVFRNMWRDQVFDDELTTGGSFKTVHAIARHSHWTLGGAKAGHWLLAGDAHVTTRTVIRAVAFLEERGHAERAPRKPNATVHIVMLVEGDSFSSWYEQQYDQRPKDDKLSY